MGPDAQKKVLRIKRLVNGEWKTEVIRDPAVIAAYVKRRQVIEARNGHLPRQQLTLLRTNP